MPSLPFCGERWRQRSEHRQASFYEKALFVKPTWRPLCGGRDCSLPFARYASIFYPHCQ